jgi:hypothetical protein
MRSAARATVRTTRGSRPDESRSYRTLMNWLINWLGKVTDKRYRRAQRKRAYGAHHARWAWRCARLALKFGRGRNCPSPRLGAYLTESRCGARYATTYRQALFAQARQNIAEQKLAHLAYITRGSVVAQ